MSITGAYVSGTKASGKNETPAMMRPAQKVHLQLMGDRKPDITGPNNGPNIVEAMNNAIALPLVTGSSYISAYSPPVTEIALDALIPTINLNTSSVGQLGATAHASVNSVKNVNVGTMMILLP